MKNINYLLMYLVLRITALKISSSGRYDYNGSGLVKCIENSKLQSKRIAMMSSEVESVSYASEIIKALSSPVMIINSDSEFSVEDVTFIIFSIKRYFYYDLFKRVRIEDKARVLVMWKWPVTSIENFETEKGMNMLREILAIMWLHQIYDVYVLVEDESFNVKIYTYLPYGETHCNGVGPPLLIDTWNSTSGRFMTDKFRIDNSKSDTRRRLMKNLYGCPVHVLVKNRPPESIAMMTSDNRLVLKGSGGSILSSLMKRFNFTVKIKLAEDGLRWTTRDKYGLAMSSYTASMLIQELRTGQYDFAFGVFSYLGYFSPDMDLSQYYLNENFAFYVPCGTEKKILSIWNDYHMEFSASTWACIGVVFLLVALVLKIIATILPREDPKFLSFWRNVFSLWAVHVENGLQCKTVTTTMRVLVTALMFYCTIMSVAYRASLKSLLLAPWEEQSITTWAELEQSGLSITGIPDMYDIFSKISTRHKTLRKLQKRFQVKTSDTFRDIVDDVTIKRQTAYFGPESMIVFYNSMENEQNGTKKQTICQVNRIVATSPASPFLMRRGSIFLHIINQVTNDMVQTGQMKQFALSQAMKGISRHNIKDNHRPTSMSQLKGAFLLLLTGLTLAATTFLCETLYSRFKLGKLVIIRHQDGSE